MSEPNEETLKRESVPLEDAIRLLPESERIHTFRGSGFVLIGVHWDRLEIIEAMERYGVELSGEVATSMNHGLCLNDGGWLFIETRRSEPLAGAR